MGTRTNWRGMGLHLVALINALETMEANDSRDKLNELDRQYQRGLLSEQEYERMKGQTTSEGAKSQV